MRSLTRVVGLVLLVLGAVALAGTLGPRPGVVREAFGWLVPLGVIGVGLWILAAGTWNRRAGGAESRWSTGGSALAQGPLSPDGAGPRPALGISHSSEPAQATRDTARSGAGASADAGWDGASRGVDRIIGEIEVAGPLVLGPTRFQTLIGEVRLDLTAASLPEGETPVSVSTLVGEVRVLLPPEVGAIVRARTLLGEVEVLGAVEGPLFPDRIATTDDYATATRRIRLDVQSSIGRVGVRRARADAAADATPAESTVAAAPVADAGFPEPGLPEPDPVQD